MFPQLDVVTLIALTASAIQVHRRIVDALRKRDATFAGRRMTAHVKMTTKELRQLLAE